MANLSHITRCGLLGSEWVPFWHERFFFGEFRQGGQAEADYDQDQSRDARRDSRHNPAPRELLHEQIQEAGLH
jgi:hypothetical protein